MKKERKIDRSIGSMRERREKLLEESSCFGNHKTSSPFWDFICIVFGVPFFALLFGVSIGIFLLMIKLIVFDV